MKRASKIFIIAAMSLAAILFIRTLTFSVFLAPESAGGLNAPPVTLRGASSSNASTVPAASYPDRLLIPALGVDAAIQYLGINAKGNMMAPSNFTDVGWYRFGTVPGEPGSAVIDGHLDNGLGLAGVFKNLDRLQPGDQIEVLTKGGAKVVFAVAAVQAYPSGGVPADFIFNRTGGAYLNLITCDGDWVPSADSYNERLVVFAVKE